MTLRFQLTANPTKSRIIKNPSSNFCDEQKSISETHPMQCLWEAGSLCKLRAVLWRVHRAPLSWNGTTAFHPIKAKGFQSALYTWMNNSLQAWPARRAPFPAGQAGLLSAHKLVSVPLQRSLPQALERAIVPAWVSTTAQEPPREHNSLDLASTANFSTAHHREFCSRPCCRAGSSINPVPWNMWEGARGAGRRCKCTPLFLGICSQNTQTGKARRNSVFVMERKK